MLNGQPLDAPAAPKPTQLGCRLVDRRPSAKSLTWCKCSVNKTLSLRSIQGLRVVEVP